MIKEIYYLDFFNGLLDGEKERCKAILDDLLASKIPVVEIYVSLFQRSMYQIGRMWEHSKITIAQEHCASQIVDDLISGLISTLTPPAQTGKSIVIACVDKEFHFLGAKIVAQMFELSGWRVYFLGQSTPTNTLLSYIEEKKPDLVGISFNFYLRYVKFFEILDTIKKVVPTQRILIGGQGITEYRDKIMEEYPGIIYFDNLYTLNEFISKYEPVASGN